MFGSSMKKDAIVNIFTGSNMFTKITMRCLQQLMPRKCYVTSEVCRHGVDTSVPHWTALLQIVWYKFTPPWAHSPWDV